MSSVSAQLLRRATELHQAMDVVDLHNDFLLKARFFRKDFLRRGRPQTLYMPWRTDLDLHRVAEGGVSALGFALWAGRRIWADGRRGAFAFTNDLMDRLETMIATAPEQITLARSASEVRAARTDGKLAAFVGIEGAQAIEDDLDKLDHFYQRGVRYVGLTWNTSPSFARAAFEVDKKRPGAHDGLTGFGKAVIQRLNDLGMMIDLAHSSERTCWDVLDASKDPVFNSHTGLSGVHPHPRNIADDMIKAIAKRGGVIGIIFCPSFLGPLYSDLNAVADHIDHLATVGGVKCVALGSDFDGFIPLPRGMRDVRDLPKLTALLLQRGHSEPDIEGFLGQNFLAYFGRFDTGVSKGTTP